jgi:hypothetical protein
MTDDSHGLSDSRPQDQTGEKENRRLLVFGITQRDIKTKMAPFLLASCVILAASVPWVWLSLNHC